MQAQSTFSILFWIEKSRLKNGKAPLSARITVDGKRAEISTHRKVSLLEWDTDAQMLVSKSQEAKDTNNYLAIMKAKLLSCQSKLEARGEDITAEKIKNEYVGVRAERKTIADAFAFKLKLLKEEIEKEKKVQATYVKYEYTLDKIKSFLQAQYKVTGMYLDEVKFSFINDLEHYLSITLNLDNNTSMKHISRTKTVFKMALERGWVLKNPISTFRCTFIERDPLRLEMEELVTLYEKPITIKKYEEARDCYVFMCYTGFAYIDAYGMTDENIFWGIDKQLWISRNRQKTDGTECVPLLPTALEIINKYKSHPACINKGKLLPLTSNQKFNEYLKAIAAICEINKELTTHTGRHTFATTVTLENDVPIETVGKMLGHRSLKSTQRYARVTRKKIHNNMNDLRAKLYPVITELKTGS